MFMLTLNMSGEEEGFDRERILEWLRNVELKQPSEPDRGSPFDPDSTSTTQTFTPPTQQQQQVRVQPSVPMEGGKKSRVISLPVISLPRLTTSRAHSMHSLPVPERRANVLQAGSHLWSQHCRKKSDSPLPEVPSDPELPIFNPQSPVPPGNRTRKLSPLKSDMSGAGFQVPIPVCPRSGLGTVQQSCPTLYAEVDPPRPSSTTLQQRTERETTAIKSIMSAPDLGARESPSDNKVSFTAPQEPIFQLLGGGDSHEEEEREGEEEGVRDGAGEKEEQEGAGEKGDKEEVGGISAPLSDEELAKLSLQVVDILPQLAVYLCIDYSEYQHIVWSEPSPQRQSMAVLMSWFQSGTGHGRRELAHALQHFGDKHKKLAQMLLRGKLEESHHSMPYEADVSSPQKPHPSSVSPTPSPLCRSPLPSHPIPHTSPEHQHHTSPSLLHHSAQAWKLKQGFTFDEGQHSRDTLPKFLSSRSLHNIVPSKSHRFPRTVRSQSAQLPDSSIPLTDHRRGQHRVKRQDSGIETLASNSPAIP